jgi:hypothetical protein
MALILASRSCPRARRAHGCPQASAQAWLYRQACLWVRLGPTLGNSALVPDHKRSHPHGLARQGAGVPVPVPLAMLRRPLAGEGRLVGTFLS